MTTLKYLAVGYYHTAINPCARTVVASFLRQDDAELFIEANNNAIGATELELEIEPDPQAAKFYVVRATPIHDWRDAMVGTRHTVVAEFATATEAFAERLRLAIAAEDALEDEVAYEVTDGRRRLPFPCPLGADADIPF